MKISRIAEVVDIVCIDVDQSSLFGFFKNLVLVLVLGKSNKIYLVLVLVGRKMNNIVLVTRQEQEQDKDFRTRFNPVRKTLGGGQQSPFF